MCADAQQLYTNPYKTLHQSLPRIAAEFRVSVDDLHIMEYYHFPLRYMSSDYRDTPYKLVGILEGMPFIQGTGKRSKCLNGVGIAFYRSRHVAGLQWAMHCQPGNFTPIFHLVSPKCQLFKLFRTAQRLSKLSCVNPQKPVLEPGIVEDVVRHSVGFLQKASSLDGYGVKAMRGILLDGPPGNGKTMLCRYIEALAIARNYKVGTVQPSEIEKAFNEGSLVSVFQRYHITFFDDIDITYMDRSSGRGNLACAMLAAMDGIAQTENRVRIFTTNEQLDSLDPAFKRPGRIDKIITLKKPAEALRRELVLSWPEALLEGVGFRGVDDIIARTEGFSFAEVEAIRTLLVVRRVVDDRSWNVDAAFDEYHRRSKDYKKSLGFTQNKPIPTQGVGVPNGNT